MVDDKYIGLALAVSGSIAIGTSFIITKKVCLLSCVLSMEIVLSSCVGSKRCRGANGLRQRIRELRVPQKPYMVGRNVDECVIFRGYA